MGETYQMNILKAVESGYKFNMDRIAEMYTLIRSIAAIKDVPKCNPNMSNAIKECNDYIDRWKKYSEAYPSGIPIAYPYVEVPVPESNEEDAI